MADQRSTQVLIEQVNRRGYLWAKCSNCNAEARLEPDARDIDCPRDTCDGTISSPLVRRGMI